MACVLGSATPALAADAAFTAAPDVALHSLAFPQALAVGDFNSDGRQDLAIADFGRDRVYSRLGNGDGTFRDGGEVTGLGRPQDVVVGDFDADGIEDLAVAGDYPVAVLRGVGDGRFALASGFPLPGQSDAHSLAVGDFDGNGTEDLAAAGSSHVSVRLGAGNGTFAGGVDVPFSNPYPGALAAGDFDGNGKQDLALTLTVNSGPSSVGVLPGLGNGTFEPVKTVGLPNLALELGVGDFNGDAKEDVVVPILPEGRVSVRLGNGDGTLSDDAPDVAVGERPSAVAVGDFDSDGREDLVTTNYYGESVSVRLGNGDGTFRDGGTLPAGDSPLAPAVGDLNADGKQDLATANYTGASVSVRLGSGQPPLADNLLVNGGFEQGLPARLPSQSPAIPGWSSTGGMTFARYGAHPHRGLPSWLDSPRYQTGGLNLLWGGTGGLTSAIQTVDVAGSAEPVDGARATANLSAFLGGSLADAGHMSATAEFLAASGTSLGSLTIGPVTAAQRRNVTTLLRRAGSAPVPAGTRRIRVTLTSTDTDAVSSALGDNVKLTLDTRPGGDPPAGGGSGGGPGADRNAPVIGRVTLTPARFAVARRATAITAATRGTTIRYTLSEPATVRLQIKRAAAGRRVGGRCRAVTKRSRSVRPCRRYVAAATLRRTGRPGANRVPFSGRIARRALPRGTYRLLVSAVDAAGNRSTTRPRSFRIVR